MTTSPEPWTPDTDYVKRAYVRSERNNFVASASEHEQEFDRWLREVKAKAWAEGASSVLDQSWCDGRPPGQEYLGDNPYWVRSEAA